jgi:rRNA processing protein Gar1
MRDVGAVLSVTPSGLLTARAPSDEVVPEGTTVRDARGIVRGRVVRVFGPVARPYLSIRPRRTPTPAEGLALLGASLVPDE